MASINALYAELEKTRLKTGYSPTDYASRYRVQESDLLVLSDVHVPYQDNLLLARALATGKEHDATAVVWLGDLIDGYAFNSFAVQDKENVLPVELEMAAGAIRTASALYDRQYWIRGNHENRIFRRNDFQIGMVHLAHMMGLGDLLRDGHLVVLDAPALEAAHGDWLLAHPKKYSRTPFALADVIAVREQKNVMLGHSHHWGKRKDSSGKFILVEAGTLLDQDTVQYAAEELTGFPRWGTGYWLLSHGQEMGFAW